MNRIESQKKVFAIIAVLLVLSAVAMIFIIPTMLLDDSATSPPIKAASGALIEIGLHLFVAWWFGIKLRRRSSMIRNEGYILMASKSI